MAIVPSTVLALDPAVLLSQYGHTNWRSRDGTLPGMPHVMAQTSDGLLWIGTDNGLLTFDGMRFTSWVPPSGDTLPSNSITSLLAARDGTMWIGTQAGLAHLHQGTLTRYPESSDAILYLVEDRHGVVWFARIGSVTMTNPFGVCRVAEQVRCYGPSSGIPQSLVSSLHVGVHDDLWIGTDTALARWDGRSATIYPLPSLKANVSQLGVTGIETAGGNDLWIGAMVPGPGGGLRRFSNGRWEPFRLPGLDGSSLGVTALFRDRHDALWVGTGDRGVYRIRGESVEHFGSADGLSNDYAGRFFEDREGTVWIMTPDGLDSLRDLRVISYTAREGVGSAEFDTVMAARDGTIWAGGGALGKVDRLGPRLVLAGRALPGSQVAALFEDHAGRFWIGIDDTLSIFHNGQLRRIDKRNGQPIGMAGAIVEDVNGDIWVATRGAGRELIRIHDLVVRDEWPPPAVPAARQLVADPSGGIWLGLADGDLARFSHGSLERVHFSVGPASRVDQLVLDPSGGVLAATPYGVVAWRSGQQRMLTSRNGLPCERVSALAFDAGGSLWLYASCGLIEVPEVDLRRWWSDGETRVSVHVLDVFDGAHAGLAGFQPSARGADGRLWFVNGRELQMIDPERVLRPRIPPPIHIQAVTIGGVRRQPTPVLQVPSSAHDLEIDYTAPTSVTPQRVRFRYRLDGRDTEWQEAGTRRQAFYTDLRPGTYRFHVIASNGDGPWTEEGATVAFEVAPAWYQTRTFEALAILCAGAIVSTLYRMRIRYLARTMRRQFDERLAERTRMARELHDTFVQTIQASKLVADDALEHPGEAAYVQRALERLSQWLDRAVQESRAALHSLRASTTEVNDLADAFRRATTEDLKPPSMAISFSVVGDSKDIHPIVRDEVYRIGYEAIRNAITHSAASHLDVELRYGKDLIVRVTDNGVGIDPAVARRGKDGHFGLQSMRERAGRIGARLDVVSSTAGTEVMLMVPGSMLSRPDTAPVVS
jgi:signal transduction histidine kinase/ligand-binding sensor domain-containing protein